MSKSLEHFSMRATEWAGSSLAFGIALSVIVVWVLTGPLFGYSDTWQLVINTGTTIVTFLMVFLIQRSQNKDSLALQLKLNEIVAALDGASGELSPERYRELLDSVGFKPDVRWLQRESAAAL